MAYMPNGKIIVDDISNNWVCCYGPSFEIVSKDSVDVKSFSRKLKADDKKRAEQAEKSEQDEDVPKKRKLDRVEEELNAVRQLFRAPDDGISLQRGPAEDGLDFLDRELILHQIEEVVSGSVICNLKTPFP